MKHKWDNAQWGVTYHNNNSTPVFYMANSDPGSAWLRIEELPVRRYLMTRRAGWVSPWGAPAWTTLLLDFSEPGEEEQEDYPPCIHVSGIAWVKPHAIRRPMARSPPLVWPS